MKIFPNPSSGEFIISADNGYEEISVTVEDLSGKVVYSGRGKLEDKQLKVKLELENGVYLIHIDNEDAKEVQKLVITK